MTALFRFIAPRLGNGLLRIYVAQYISDADPSVRVPLLPQDFFPDPSPARPPPPGPWETFIKGYRGVTVKRERVLTIGRSSEVISNNPLPTGVPRRRGLVPSPSSLCTKIVERDFTSDVLVFVKRAGATPVVPRSSPLASTELADHLS